MGSERNPAGSSGQYDHWLVVAGEHIHQFNSSWARQFAHTLRQKIEKRL